MSALHSDCHFANDGHWSPPRRRKSLTGSSRRGLCSLPLTIHPDVSGLPQVLLVLERLMCYISEHESVTWVTVEEIATDFRGPKPLRG